MRKLLGTLFNQRAIMLGFSLLMGALAVYLAMAWKRTEEQKLALERQQMKAEYRAPVDVVVAAKDLEEGTALEPTHLKTAAIPEAFVQPYSARTVGDVVGRVTMAPVAEGEQLLLNKLRRPDAVPRDATLSRLTPKGKRAVTIAVDTISGVGGFIQPGDAVDVLWTIRVPSPGQATIPTSQPQGDLVTLTLFQDVPVLAVGGQIKPQAMRPSAADTVTLALTPQETSFLLFAREQGRIQLSLRSGTDSGQVPVTPANINSLMEMLVVGGAPQPAGRGAGQKQVEVYRGLERDVVSLPEE